MELAKRGRLLAGGQDYLLREAKAVDLGQIIALMADDDIRRAEHQGAEEDTEQYLHALNQIDADPAHSLIVVEAQDGTLVGTMQLTILPGLARRGTTRMQIEAVRVTSALRGRGLGTAMIRWAISEAENKKVQLVQLTSDAQRDDAHRFYEALGFTASHVGFKMRLPINP
ncbi:GNAT family N-acetyltransferase [Glutamicibacter nicotianae]|uniref:GNAT family N-acetyltransferase n=1 Tax=Glutamicibacter nicotianae TaxID=37929 RepID=UPI001959F8BD|nr:GNAT family N-acetyltransferase [Glutamicibacter nicotianae]MBM7767637.1 GNAT superfamily N-acetyltransferase [Glutamicibacter nicotianae]